LTESDPPFSRDTIRTASRAQRRAFMHKYARKNGVGAELGVFWGHFSEVIMEHFQPRKLYLVDAWDLKFGETFPNWGDGHNTDHGRLTTAQAIHDIREAMKPYGDRVEIRRQFVKDFLSELPDSHFDWVYLDTSHSYRDTRDELRNIWPKLKPGGMLLGDDYHQGAELHSGLRKAVDEFVEETGIKLILEPAAQYIIPKPERPLWKRLLRR
jgi:SAM-dependent methyltransferase